MNVLIINAYSDTPKGKNNYEEFVNHIKNSFKKMTEKSSINEINFILRNYNNFDDYIDDNETASSFQMNQKTKKNFHKIDFIFIDGDEKFLPWKKQSQKIQILIKMCDENKTILFAAGVGLQILIFFLATNFTTEFNIVNSNGEITSIEEIFKIPKEFLINLKKQDYFLDYVSGDLYEYRPKVQEWVPVMNSGLHKTLIAEKYLYRGKFVLPNENHASYRPSSVNPVIKSLNTDIKSFIQKQYTNNFLVKNIQNEFVVNSTSTWFSHNFNLKRKELQYKIIASSDRGPVIVEHGNSVGVIFHINKKNDVSLKVLDNFIKNKFDEVREKGFKPDNLDHKLSNPNLNNLSRDSPDNIVTNIKSEMKDIVDVQHVEYFLKKTKMELQRQKDYLEFKHKKDNESNDNNNINTFKNNKSSSKKFLNQNQLKNTGTTFLVNNARPFHNIKLKSQIGSHVGVGFNKRDMVFVDNNSVNARPVTSKPINKNLPIHRPGSPFKENNSFAFYLSSTNFNKNKGDLNIEKLNKHPINVTNKINTSTNTFKHLNSKDDLRNFIEENDTMSDEYKSFVHNNRLDEDKMLEFYKLKTRQITNKLVENYKRYDDEMNKLSNVKIYNTKTNRLSNSQCSPKKGKEDNKTNKLSEISLNNSNINNEDNAKIQQDKDSVNIFSIMFPYVIEEEFPKPVIRHIPGSGFNREGKDIVRVDLMKKSTNNYVEKFKQFEKDLDTFGTKPYIRCSAPYLTEDEIYRREFLESKKNWMNTKDFGRVFGKKTTNLKPIPSIIANGSPPGLTQHQYREIDRAKWITKKNFIL